MLAKAQSATECSHTYTHRNKCHPNVHITLPATRTHTFYSSVLPARELPAVGDLWENRTPPVPLSSPHAPREGLCPTGATSIYSLIPGLIGACLLFFLLFPPSVFVVPSHRSSFVFDLEAPDSVQLPQRLSHQKAFCIWYLKWRRWSDTMRFHFGVKVGNFAKWCLCCWQIGIWPARQRYVCAKQVKRSAYLSLCVYISSLVNLSPLPAPCFAFG